MCCCCRTQAELSLCCCCRIQTKLSLCCRVQQAAQQAQALALSSLAVPSVAAACVCFLELLGLDSLRLRVALAAARRISSHRTRSEASLHRDSLGKVSWSALGVSWEEEQGGMPRCCLVAQQGSKSL